MATQSSNNTQQFANLTEWQVLADDYANSEMGGNVKHMRRVYRRALDLFFHQRNQIPRYLNPIQYMEIEHDYSIHHGDPRRKRVPSSVVSAWLDDMAHWSIQASSDKFG